MQAGSIARLICPLEPTGGALLPLTANSFPINSNFVNAEEEICVGRGS